MSSILTNTNENGDGNINNQLLKSRTITTQTTIATRDHERKTSLEKEKFGDEVNKVSKLNKVTKLELKESDRL